MEDVMFKQFNKYVLASLITVTPYISASDLQNFEGAAKMKGLVRHGKKVEKGEEAGSAVGPETNNEVESVAQKTHLQHTFALYSTLIGFSNAYMNLVTDDFNYTFHAKIDALVNADEEMLFLNMLDFSTLFETVQVEESDLEGHESYPTMINAYFNKWKAALLICAKQNNEHYMKGTYAAAKNLALVLTKYAPLAARDNTVKWFEQLNKYLMKATIKTVEDKDYKSANDAMLKLEKPTFLLAQSLASTILQATP